MNKRCYTKFWMMIHQSWFFFNVVFVVSNQTHHCFWFQTNLTNVWFPLSLFCSTNLVGLAKGGDLLRADPCHDCQAQGGNNKKADSLHSSLGPFINDVTQLRGVGLIIFWHCVWRPKLNSYVSMTEEGGGQKIFKIVLRHLWTAPF